MVEFAGRDTHVAFASTELLRQRQVSDKRLSGLKLTNWINGVDGVGLNLGNKTVG